MTITHNERISVIFGRGNLRLRNLPYSSRTRLFRVDLRSYDVDRSQLLIGQDTLSTRIATTWMKSPLNPETHYKHFAASIRS